MYCSKFPGKVKGVHCSARSNQHLSTYFALNFLVFRCVLRWNVLVGLVFPDPLSVTLGKSLTFFDIP